MTTGLLVASFSFIAFCFFLGAIAALAGVYLGAWFVYRTKREPYETLHTAPVAEAYNIDDFDDLTGEAMAQRFEGPVDEFLGNSLLEKARDRFEASIKGDLGPTPDMPEVSDEQK